MKWPGVVAAVQTARGIFVVPPGAAVWIPPDERHGGLYTEAAEERSLYVLHQHCATLPSHSCAVRVTPRVAELMGLFVSQYREEHADWLERERSALAVLHAQLVDAGVQPLPLTIPERSPVLAVTNAVLADPTLERTLLEWAEFLGMSQSSLDRAFRRDTGLALGSWCRRARLLHALHGLASGAEVASVAREIDYGSSAFVQMFRKTLHTTPARYFAALADSAHSPAPRGELPVLVRFAGGCRGGEGAVALRGQGG